MKRLIGLTLLFAISTVTSAQETLVFGRRTTECTATAGSKVLEWAGPVPEWRDTTLDAVASRSAGRAYGLFNEENAVGDSVPRLVSVNRQGEQTLDPVFGGQFNRNLVALSAGRDGTIYAAEGFAAGQILRARGGDRVWMNAFADGTYDNSAGAVPFDLAADQCTIFMIRERSLIRRFNGCTGTVLPDFATVPGGDDLRVLPDGGLLVAAGTNLVRLDAAGAVTRTYSVAGSGAVTALALESGGTIAVAAQRGCTARPLRRIDLATGTDTAGATIRRVHEPMHVIPARAWTAGIGEAHGGAHDVPTLSTIALFALIALVATIALRRVV